MWAIHCDCTGVSCAGHAHFRARREQEAQAAEGFAHPPRAFRTHITVALSKKGTLMIRGHFPSRFVLLALFGAAVAAAQAHPEAPSAATPQQPKITNTETIEVTASGEFRDEQEMQAPTLLEEAPGTSPIKSIAQLPSVNFEAADPTAPMSGQYASQCAASIRTNSDLRWTTSAWRYVLWQLNGLHISRAITDENVGRIVLSQGTGALETASTSTWRNPPVLFRRPVGYARRGCEPDLRQLQCLSHLCPLRERAAAQPHQVLSHWAYQLTDKWRGHGDIGQNYWQLNGKVVRYIGSGGVLSAFADVSDRREVDYQDDNKVWVQKLGYNWTTLETGRSRYRLPGLRRSGNLSSAVNTLNLATDDPCDAGYYGGSGLRKDTIGASATSRR